MTTIAEQPASPSARASSVAFASYVDNNYLPGFEVLFKSMLLNNPWFDHDFIVYYDDLTVESVERISLLYPKFVWRRINGAHYSSYEKGDNTNYLVEKAYYILEAFRERGYDRLVTLDVDMVVLGDIEHLATTDAAFTAVPQLFQSRGGWRINSGVMSFDRSAMSDDFVQRMDKIGRAGAYDLERHDQGVLSAVLDGKYTKLDSRYNLVKRAVKREQLPPEDTRIFHFTGSTKPWSGGEVDYAAVEALWAQYDLPAALFWRRAAATLPEESAVQDFYTTRAARFEFLSDDDLLDLRSAASRLFAIGDFEKSALARKLSIVQAPKVPAHAWLDYGTTLLALSRRQEAEAAFILAQDNNRVGPKASTQLARMHWTYRDYDAAQAAVVEALRADPTQRRARLLLTRIQRSRSVDSVIPDGDGPAIGHVAFYVDPEGNFGDVMLPIAVRASLESAIPNARWSSVHAHQVFDLERARWANENLAAIVIGGGGLFLPDTAPNGNSGWQWNVTDEALAELRIPIVVYTVGYNLFPGQSFFGDRFETSVKKLIEKAEFVGLRNHGSVNSVSHVVGPGPASKIEFLPCVTTVYGPLAGRVRVEGESRSADGASRPIAYLNIAFDREDLRFGDGYEAFVAELAAFINAVSDRVEVQCLAHAKLDERIAHDLRRSHGVRIRVVALQLMEPDAALDLLERAAVVVGMRGHAGMIPFGVGTPIVSIISHNKLRFFLEDIKHPEWGVEVDDPQLGSRLTTLVTDIVADQPRYRGEVAAARAVLQDIAESANARIAKAIMGS
jgi:lipopolysaccharide biosynthesis glycosyltransferase